MERRENESDFYLLLRIIENNLRKKECPKTHKSGCMGECEDCLKWKIFVSIHNCTSEDSFLTATNDEIEKIINEDNFEIIENENSPSREERINFWQKYYEDVDFGDNWEDYLQGDPINERQGKGKTLLHLAVERDDLGTICKLIAEGIDPSVKDNSGYTAGDIAILEEKMEVVKLMASLGVLE